MKVGVIHVHKHLSVMIGGGSTDMSLTHIRYHYPTHTMSIMFGFLHNPIP